jgi:hypothetical protein
MPEPASIKPASASEVRAIVGELDDAVIARIVATDATAAELLEAFTWLTADDQLGTDLERTCSGRVAQVYEILDEETQPLDER